ncbi:MAG: hypothetical protein QG635_901, partial [Bacteroidota bacterium]|nr:hypothetical protein [Bacteroidota bacterium]
MKEKRFVLHALVLQAVLILSLINAVPLKAQVTYDVYDRINRNMNIFGKINKEVA